METQTFADQLIAARRAAGLTQAQLALYEKRNTNDVAWSIADAVECHRI